MHFDRESLSEQVENALREEIASGRLRPGQRVPVSTYQEAWSVSVTPLRDAMRSLEGQGFLRVEPRRGVFVAEVNEEMLVDAFGVRIGLECIACELATPRAPEAEIDAATKSYQDAARAAEDGNTDPLRDCDNAVHDLVAKWSGNSRLKRLLVGEERVINWAQSMVIDRLPNALMRALPEHLAILEAMRARDPSAAHRAMRLHLENSCRLTVEALKQSVKAEPDSSSHEPH